MKRDTLIILKILYVQQTHLQIFLTAAFILNNGKHLMHNTKYPRTRH